MSSSTEDALKAAKVALRDAEIECELEQNAQDIAVNGRCAKWRGHFDKGSFIFGFMLAILLVMSIAGTMVGHR